MTRLRVLTALAAMLTALLVQATVVAPAAYPWSVSLPALVVAAIGLWDGPGAGMSFGFAAGLLADLASRHPAGLLALVWMAVGMLGGVLAERRGVVRDALVCGAVCTAAGTLTSLVLIVVDGGGSVPAVVTQLGPTALVSVVLALAIVPLVRAVLRSEALRSRRPLGGDLAANDVIGAGRD